MPAENLKYFMLIRKFKKEANMRMSTQIGETCEQKVRIYTSYKPL